VIFISKYIVPRGYIGITVYPFIFLKATALKENLILVNHEKIHLKQQLELLIVPFYIIYILEFLIRLIKYKNWCLAYSNISFEREAFKNEMDLDFLKTRRIWNFMYYF
tara:strand:+ start:172390 stop:172713 length:324 start_codon:yes stop_codon:yes gene_type:complete